MKLSQEEIVSDWIQITQDRINAFADATSDHQWIHVDPTRGATIAHGYLTLSLIPHLTERSVHIEEKFARKINYGANRIRFPHPVKVNSRLRTRTKPKEVTEVEGGWQVVWLITMEIENETKPAMVAEVVTRYYY